MLYQIQLILNSFDVSELKNQQQMSIHDQFFYTADLLIGWINR